MDHGEQQLVSSQSQLQPPAKRIRRSTADIRRQRQQAATAAGLADAALEKEVESVTAASDQARFLDLAEPIGKFEADEQDPVDAGGARGFATAASQSKRQTTAALDSQLQPVDEEASPVLLTSSEEIGNDMSLKTGLRLTNPHGSLRWLRRLPAGLRCQT